MKGEFFMAYKSIPAINIAGEPKTPPDDPGKEAIDICRRAWNSAQDEQAENGNQPIGLGEKLPAQNTEKIIK